MSDSSPFDTLRKVGFDKEQAEALQALYIQALQQAVQTAVDELRQQNGLQDTTTAELAGIKATLESMKDNTVTLANTQNTLTSELLSLTKAVSALQGEIKGMFEHLASKEDVQIRVQEAKDAIKTEFQNDRRFKIQLAVAIVGATIAAVAFLG